LNKITFQQTWQITSPRTGLCFFGRGLVSSAFGRVADKEFGTYFIGYARSPRTIEQMLENMFIGRPPGNYDRLLDFSFAKTGSLFFVPSATFLDNVADDVPSAEQTLSDTPTAAPQPAPKRDGSLGIGSLKGDPAS
jgi:putative iron-dependent peroxidase